MSGGRQLESLERLASDELVAASDQCSSRPDHIWNYGKPSCNTDLRGLNVSGASS